jgi:hypothetical protein
MYGEQQMLIDTVSIVRLERHTAMKLRCQDVTGSCFGGEVANLESYRGRDELQLPGNG